MGLNYALLRTVTAREIVSALPRDGFALDRQAGSHRHYFHPDGRRVTVGYHAPGETFRLKTLKSMLKIQAGWSEDDLRRLRFIQ